MAAGPVPGRMSAAWDSVKNQLSGIFGAAAAVGFFFGYVSVSLFAWGLGVTPHDLDLTTQDYVTLAASWLMLFGSLGVLFFVYRRMTVDVNEQPNWWRAVVRESPLAAIGLLVIVTVISSDDLRRSPLMWLAVFVLGWTAVALVMAGLAKPRSAVMMSLLAVGVVITLGGSYSIATDLKSDDALDKPVPVWISIVLPVHEGIMTIAGQEECVLRIAERVYVLEGTVHVDTESRAFRPEDCTSGP